MADRSTIEWTDATWNPIRARRRSTGKLGWHCEHVSEGCRNCYAERRNANSYFGNGLAYKPGHRAEIDLFLDEKVLMAPLRWRKPRMIFVGSMTDLFADFVSDEMLDRIFAIMALCPQHTFQVLTKRSARMRRYVSYMCNRDDLIANAAVDIAREVRGNSESLHRSVMVAVRCPLPNLWLGVSAEDQPRADERIPDLLATPAAVRFVSAEPLLGLIEFTRIACPAGCLPPDYCNHCDPDGGEPRGTLDALGNGSINQVIVGGESGPHARPMHPDWARSIRDQCAAAGVSFFFKQWGEFKVSIDRDRDDPDWRQDYKHRYGHGQMSWINLAGGCGFHGERFHVMHRVGKKAAGRLLDGIEHNGRPGSKPMADSSPAPPQAIPGHREDL